MRPSFLLLLALLPCLSSAQTSTRTLENVLVQASQAQFLGKTRPVRELIPRPATSPGKKDVLRKMKKTPVNFRGRQPGGNAVHREREHQGPDPLRQKGFPEGAGRESLELLVNIQGLGDFGSPHDPTGDVSEDHYVQAINVTFVGVFDREGDLLEEFPMNTLWFELGVFSAGDPIVLYDEIADRWFITEFTDPANLLIAVSETGDPLGSYFAWSFATPEFPDYPKYALSPQALVVTTNEGGGGTLHQYFLDLEALRAGSETVSMIRVELPGNAGTESGFYVTTPVDVNGTLPSPDPRPMALRINDSSWPGGPAQDQIELYTFNLDFLDPANTTVEQTSIVTTPFDPYPCSAEGFGFSCVPQPQGIGLDAVPEVIMNIPHLRRIGDHESLVFTFITDVTDGENLSGLRWVELRRSAGSDWSLHQEDTFAPEDGLDRYMGSIAIDDRGNIALAYNVSSEDTYAGLRFTGRLASDPPGVMTIPEVTVAEGLSEIASFGRFGDYAHMSVSPKGDNTFWFTAEYATDNDAGTRIAAFRLSRDTFDLQAAAIPSPQTSHTLGDAETVIARIGNPGLSPLAGFEIGLMRDEVLVEKLTVADTLQPEGFLEIPFNTTLDLDQVGEYRLTLFVHHPLDANPGNDTLRVTVRKLNARDGALSLRQPEPGCEEEVTVTLTLRNLGGEPLTEALIGLEVDGLAVDTFPFTGLLSYLQGAQLSVPVQDHLNPGLNRLRFTLLEINGHPDTLSANNRAEADLQRLRPGEFVTLRFTTDEYPEESSWEIRLAGSGTVVARSGAYDLPNHTYEHRICLPADSCYVLTVRDVFGDGICCDFGEGSFMVLDSAGQVLIANDGQFGQFAEEPFCPRGECVLQVAIAVQHASGPAVADGSLLLSVSGGAGPFRYSLDGGVQFQDAPLFEGLLPGVYEVVVIGQDSTCFFRDTVTVSFVNSTTGGADGGPGLRCFPNPTRDLFEVEVEGWQEPTDRLDIEILNHLGQPIQHRHIGRYDGVFRGECSLMAWPAGTYYVLLRGERTRILQRVIRVE